MILQYHYVFTNDRGRCRERNRKSDMNKTLESIRLAKELGGRDGLNCIAELDENAAALPGKFNEEETVTKML